MKAALLADGVRTSATAAGAWLEASAANLRYGSLANSMRAAIASVIACDGGTTQASKALAVTLVRTRGCSVDELAACGGPLVLLFCLAASRLGGALNRPLTRFVDEAATALDDVGSISPGVGASAYLVARLRQRIRSADAAPPMEDRAYVYSDRNAVQVIEGVECGSAFGSDQIAAPPELAERLAAIALSRLRRYDFELGCRAARSLNYAGGGTSLGMTTAIAFLRAQQDFDGSFGFFDRETAEFRCASGADHAALEFKIPTTLACLWTLAEYDSHGYCVFRDIGRSARSSEPP